MNPVKPNSLSDADLLSLAVGCFLPLLIAVIQQPRWPDRLRALVTAFVCVVVGLAETYLRGDIVAGNILRSVLLTLIAANGTYQGFWKHVGARKIEIATVFPGVGQWLDERKRRAEEDALIAHQVELDRAAMVARARGQAATNNAAQEDLIRNVPTRTTRVVRPSSPAQNPFLSNEESETN